MACRKELIMKKYNTLVGKIVAVITVLIFSTSGTIFSSWVEDTSFDNTQATFTDIDLLDTGASTVDGLDISDYLIDSNYEILEYRLDDGTVVSKGTAGATGHLPGFWDIKDMGVYYDGFYNSNPSWKRVFAFGNSIEEASESNMFISSHTSYSDETYLSGARSEVLYYDLSEGVIDNHANNYNTFYSWVKPGYWSSRLFDGWDPYLLDAVVRSSRIVNDTGDGNQGSRIDYFTSDFLIAPPNPETSYDSTGASYTQTSADNIESSLWLGSTFDVDDISTYGPRITNSGRLYEDDYGDIWYRSVVDGEQIHSHTDVPSWLCGYDADTLNWEEIINETADGTPTTDINLSDIINNSYWVDPNRADISKSASWAAYQDPENYLWMIDPTATFNLDQLVYGDESFDHPLNGLNVSQLFAESLLLSLCNTASGVGSCQSSNITSEYNSLDSSYWVDTDSDGLVDNGDSVDGVGLFTAQSDIDGDLIPDSVDTDIDGDGVDNDVDAFPNDASETVDTDGDGTGNVADTDDDGDGVDDSSDGDPLDSMIGGDDDGDGKYAFLGSWSDYASLILTEQQDVDRFDNDETESLDANGNGIGDNADSAAITHYVLPDSFESAVLAPDPNNDNLGDNGHDMASETADKISKTNIEIAHSTPATIGFEVKHSSDAGKLTNEQTIIAAFHVVNNTIDGFKVTLTSANGGKLLPVAGQNLHGETSIDYTLDIDKGVSPMLSQQGSVEGGNVNTQGLGHFNITDKTARTLIVGQGQSSGTDSSYVISITLDDESTDSGYGLAGIYKEALLLTYQDF